MEFRFLWLSLALAFVSKDKRQQYLISCFECFCICFVVVVAVLFCFVLCFFVLCCVVFCFVFAFVLFFCFVSVLSLFSSHAEEISRQTNFIFRFLCRFRNC